MHDVTRTGPVTRYQVMQTLNRDSRYNRSEKTINKSVSITLFTRGVSECTLDGRIRTQKICDAEKIFRYLHTLIARLRKTFA